MKILANKRILMAVASLVTVWTVTAGIAYGATFITKSLNARVNIVDKASFSFFADAAAAIQLTEVRLPDVSEGGKSTFTFYLKNTSSVAELISAGVDTVPLSVGRLTLKFDGQNEKILAPGAICKVTGTLSMFDDIETGTINFSFSVNAQPVSEGTVSPTTNPPPTTTLTGQQLFAINCTSCHSSPPNNSLTQSQLTGFISGHRTGTSLTSEQVGAIAVYIKP